MNSIEYLWFIHESGEIYSSCYNNPQTKANNIQIRFSGLTKYLSLEMSKQLFKNM